MQAGRQAGGVRALCLVVSPRASMKASARLTPRFSTPSISLQVESKASALRDTRVEDSIFPAGQDRRGDGSSSRVACHACWWC